MAIKGKEILIVEDVADQMMFARRILENVGVNVSEANSVDMAFEILMKKSPHLVLLDLRMPQTSGFDFLQQKGAYPNLTSVPIIVTSSLNDKNSLFKAISLGAIDYILKPMTAQTLLQKVRKHLKDTEYQSYEFITEGKGAESPEIKLTTHSQIFKLSHTNFYLESPVKFGPQEQLFLQGKSFEKLGLSHCFFVSDTIPFIRTISGGFSGKIHAVGIKKTIINKDKGELS